MRVRDGVVALAAAAAIADVARRARKAARRTPAPSGAPRVVVLGAGFAGLNAARALAGRPVQVVVVDQRNHHLFQPLLYQVATAALSPGDIAAPIRHVLREQRNAEVILGEVAAVEPASRSLRLEDGTRVPYDVSTRLAATTYPVTVQQEVRLRLLRAP